MFPILRGEKKNEKLLILKGFWIIEIDGSLILE
jgi:hypothetical protein